MPRTLRRSASQVLRFAVGLPFVFAGLLALSVALVAMAIVVAVVFALLALTWAADVVDVAITVGRVVPYGRRASLAVVVLIAGVGAAFGLWLWAGGVRRLLAVGRREEPAAVVAGTRPPETESERLAEGVLDRLSSQADHAAPALRVRDCDRPLCYTVGYPIDEPPGEVLDDGWLSRLRGEDEVATDGGTTTGERSSTQDDLRDRPVEVDAVVVVSTGLLDRLDERTLQAALAHELGHVVHQDPAVANYLLVPVFWSEVLAAEVGTLEAWAVGVDGARPRLGAAIRTLSGIGVATILRGRELVADDAAVRLTGDPAALADALRRLDGAEAPRTDLRTTASINLVPDADRPLLPRGPSTHPSTETRIERLERMADDE